MVKESKLLTFSYLNESDLESTLTNLDQELYNMELDLDLGQDLELDNFKNLNWSL